MNVKEHRRNYGSSSYPFHGDSTGEAEPLLAVKAATGKLANLSMRS